MTLPLSQASVKELSLDAKKTFSITSLCSLFLLIPLCIWLAYMSLMSLMTCIWNYVSLKDFSVTAQMLYFILLSTLACLPLVFSALRGFPGSGRCTYLLYMRQRTKDESSQSRRILIKSQLFNQHVNTSRNDPAFARLSPIHYPQGSLPSKTRWLP